MFIANTWTSAVNITADWGGQSLNVATAAYVPSGTGENLAYTPLGTGGLQPGQVAILFLDWNATGNQGSPPTNWRCPTGITPAVYTDAAVHGVAMGKAFHITTDRPIVAYDMFPFGGGNSAIASATLLVPTSAWDVNYLAVNAWDAVDLINPAAQPFIQIVASQANTTVQITPTSNITGGNGVPGTVGGTTGSYTLANPGDYVQFTQAGFLTGSPILADKPVGVWGGATSLNIDVNTHWADMAHQQLFPVKTFGQEYVAVRYPDRFMGMPESTPWRLVGAVSGTTLTYDPAPPSGAPTALNVGSAVTFYASDPFVVRSQDNNHPFYMSAYMTGADRMNPSETDGRGDPEFVNVIPPAEFLSSYVFFTDPTYPDTHLVVTRVKGPNGFADVNLDCLGNIPQWLPVGGSGSYEYAYVTLSTGNFQAQGSCDNGRRTISSLQPFGLTVWGWGSAATSIFTQDVSYAYPAGAAVQPINTVVIQPNQ
jgi:hypothetical protein